VLALASLLTPAGCAEWQRDITLHGVEFQQARTEPGGLVIGRLKTDTRIGGRPCAKGWLHLHPNGVPAGFTAARAIDLPRLQIPAGTWVKQNEAGVVTVCAFPRDLTVQGHDCRGTGGPTGVQAAFYPDGALKQFYPPRATRIDGVPCDRGLLRGSIELHANGRLKSALLSEDLARDGRTYPKGTRVTLDAEGRVTSAK
jgi:hypothetical protein